MAKAQLIDSADLERMAITHDGFLQAHTSQSVFSRMAAPALDGLATIYNKPHINGKDLTIEVFHPRCFENTLRSGQVVDFRLQHDPNNVVASTRDNLTLVDRAEGLAFRLLLPRTQLASIVARMVDIRSRVGMSVGYEVTGDEVHRISGNDVRFITSANLLEISLVKAGAVASAFAELVDTRLVEPPTLERLSAEVRVAYAYHKTMMAVRDLDKFREGLRDLIDSGTGEHPVLAH